ncbi:MAG: PIN domain nuclease, partial [Chloroflexi bacterium]|nr:PIN domain nuclease [Chloroflexota bacterium]
MSIEFVFRLLGGLVAAAGGYMLSVWLSPISQDQQQQILVGVAMALGGAGLGLLLTPYVTTRPASWAWRKAQHTPIQDLLAGVVGLFLGLAISALLAIPLARLPDYIGQIAPFVVTVLLSYLGVAVMVMRRHELFALFSMPARLSQREEPGGDSRILLDTSAIIDGRIVDVVQTGFITEKIVVPRFVLEELQRIADSSDAIRRNRGRRGLEILGRLQKESPHPFEVMDFEGDSGQEVDGKLMRMARKHRWLILTNDFNLNRVAALQGVKVLNINQLANALRAVVLPGEELHLRILQEGKEASQGVGYLDDGTMV